MNQFLFESGALDESGWGAIYNTTAANANDADFYVRASDRTVGTNGIYGGHIEDGQWFRLALVSDMSKGTFASYVNGVPAQLVTGEPIDGVFTLYTIDQPEDGIHLFADPNGANSRGLVNSVQIRDVALSEEEVAAFGGPAASGVPSIPPCPHLLTASLDAAARSATLSWKIGPNPPGTAFALRRDGQDLTEVPLGQTSYVDTNLSPGIHKYELAFKVKDTGCIDLPLVAQVDLPAAGYLFFEDFDGYADDAALHAAGWEERDENDPVEDADWTVGNPDRNHNPPSSNGRPTSGRFIVSSSNTGGVARQNLPGSGMSHDLWSPAFSVSGSGPVWLHFDAAAQLNNNGDAVFDVEISTDGGTSWTNVLRRISPGRTLEPAPEFGTTADGLFGRVHVDLSALAPDGSSARLRLRHFEPTWDWWVAVDDVLVDRSPPGGDREPMAEVDFTGGIPADWTAVHGPGSDQADGWSTADDCNISLLKTGGTFPDLAQGHQLHHLDDAFALVDPVCSGAGYDEYLMTPELDLSAETRVFLHFQSAIHLPRNARAEVLLSTDGGATFKTDPVFSYNLGGVFIPGEEPFFDDFVLEAPDAAGKAEAVFAFHFLTQGLPGSVTTGWWAVDSVRVTSSCTPAGTPFVRGDCNGDGTIDITDAVNNLGYQFLGTFTPACLDALDDDDSGAIDINDPVYSLGRQFLGGPVWKEPYPNCGLDPTPDSPADLGCQKHDACP